LSCVPIKLVIAGVYLKNQCRSILPLVIKGKENNRVKTAL
jgi:hypothetical protein